ncbi:FtsX-like permease family protein [Ktedonospora formicarum]|uniref:ABC transporter permease n=1 Tax=Ktedonospora formicarum TaxID=2778364 RepID=A0A8J3HU68_9CHLR|nr:ABC transporter permease [Ktedonospora formicarum]GHO43814.1 ABC transporter permease [Ktedonospora formicarum]
MEWRSIAFKNIIRNMRRYIGYLLSSGLSVAVFCLFFCFLFNPAVYQLTGLSLVAVIAGICVFIVAWFAIFFIFYFHSALMRTRNKELGLLMTLGMTPRQIGRLIFMESVCIALTAIVLGLLLGTLGTPPFLLAMGSVLGLTETIPFTFSPIPLLVTALFFGPVFLVEALLTAWRVTRQTPRMLLLGARVQQVAPRASLVKVILGLLCLGTGYALGIIFTGTSFLFSAFPIVILTMIGTFLLYGQIMVMMLGRLRKLPLHGISLLITSRLIYRLRDHSRMLSMVTILSATVLIGMGSVFGFLQIMRIGQEQQNPYDIQLLTSADTPRLNISRIDLQLNQQGITPQQELTFTLLQGTLNGSPVSVFASSDFAKLRSAILARHPDTKLPIALPLSPQQAHYYQEPELLGYVSYNPFSLPADHRATLNVGSVALTLQATQDKMQTLNRFGELPDQTLVINDQVFASLERTTPAKLRWQVYSFNVNGQKQLIQALALLEQEVGDENSGIISAQSAVARLQILSALLFAGCFVSVLFLFAAGTSIYFKLFTQQDEDRRQFRALTRLGLRKSEGIHIIATEFLLIFMLPVLFAALHSSVATIDLIRLIQVNIQVGQIIWSALGITCLIYALCFFGYYAVALVNYLRRVPVAS